MAKFWKVVKVVVFIWGALTLALIAYGLITTFVPPLFKSQESKAPAEEVAFEKKEGGYKLVVKSRETKGPSEYLITVIKDGSILVKNYRLPTQKYHFEYIDINDASFVPLRGNELGIVLYSAYADDESGSDSNVWFLKAADTTMSVREVISLSEINRSGAGGLTILGNRRISLPYQEDFNSEPFVVPVVVRISDTIAISPLLSREGADVLFSLLKQQIKAREDKMPKEKDQELAEGYRKAGKEMSEALSEKSMPY
jgi:hypothetical protein